MCIQSESLNVDNRTRRGDPHGGRAARRYAVLEQQPCSSLFDAAPGSLPEMKSQNGDGRPAVRNSPRLSVAMERTRNNEREQAHLRDTRCHCVRRSLDPLKRRTMSLDGVPHAVCSPTAITQLRPCGQKGSGGRAWLRAHDEAARALKLKPPETPQSGQMGKSGQCASELDSQLLRRLRVGTQREASQRFFHQKRSVHFLSA